MKKLSQILIVAALAAVAVVPMAPAHAATQDVTMVGTLNVPAVTVAAVGDYVKWTNMDPAAIGIHNVAGDPNVTGTPIYKFPVTSPNIVPGASWSWHVLAANKGKTYSYYCTIHPWQHGIIVVQ